MKEESGGGVHGVLTSAESWCMACVIINWARGSGMGGANISGGGPCC